MFAKMIKCPYCSADIKVTANDVFVECEYCRREMEVPRFTQEEKRLTQAVEEMRISTEAASAALDEAVKRAEESDSQMEARIAALADQMSEDSVKARMHKDELIAELRENALRQRAEAQANLEELKGEQYRLMGELDAMRKEQQAGKAASLQHCYELGEAAQSMGRFDEAIGHYQQLLVMSEDREAEVYWRIVMCRYGVQYVYEQQSDSWLPTISHMIVDSILADADYLSAERYARSENIRLYYRKEAHHIDNILNKYRQIYGQEKHYDVFISVKQGDEKGRPTNDSLIGIELYQMLKDMGLHVFNSRFSLSGHVGQEYEPYIMAALMTSKTMLVVGTKQEYISAPWVKNEWRRFRWLQENDNENRRRLIAYIVGMKPSDLPNELGVLQVIDTMTSSDPKGQLREIMEKDFGSRRAEPVAVQPQFDEEAALLRRAEMYLEDGEINKCEEYLERVLDRNPEAGMAHALKLCISMGVECIEDLVNLNRPIHENRSYRRAVSFGDAKLQARLEKVSKALQEKLDAEAAARKEAEAAAEAAARKEAEAAAEAARKEAEEAARKEAEEREREAAQAKMENMYHQGVQAFNRRQYKQALSFFQSSAKLGHEGAMIHLGIMNLDGLGMNRNVHEAVEWFTKSAAGDNAEAMWWLGNVYRDGKGINKDYKKALEWYRKSEALGNNQAMFEIGAAYEKGWGVDKNIQTALSWYDKAADAGNELAKAQADKVRKQQAAEEQARAEAAKKAAEEQARVETTQKAAEEQARVEAAKKAAEQQARPDAQTLYQQGSENLNRREYKKAHDFFCQAAELGNSEAMRWLGNMYKDGTGVEKNLQTALSWYEKAEAAGNVMAKSNVQSLRKKIADAERARAGAAQKPVVEPARPDAQTLFRQAIDSYSQKDYKKAYDLSLKAAEQGHAQAMGLLGMMFDGGKGVSVDYQEALKWYRRAVGLGDAAAMLNLGAMYEFSHGVQKDWKTALSWYERSAAASGRDESSNIDRVRKKIADAEAAALKEAEEAVRKAADLYQQGMQHYNRKEYSKAVELFKRAAEQNHAPAMFSLGDMYRFGRGVTWNCQEAIKWYSKSAEFGNTDAMCNLGYMYENGEGVAKALKTALSWYEKAIAGGMAYVKPSVDRVRKSIVEAEAADRKAAEEAKRKADAEAAARKAAEEKNARESAEDLYKQGMQCYNNREYRKAEELFKRAAEQGHAEAICELGDIYRKDERIYKDYEKALKWYRKGAELGNAKAMLKLGGMYSSGDGVVKDKQEAVKWYRKSAELGNADAMNSLAMMYDFGLGVKKDLQTALSWYEKAAAAGDAVAKKRAEDLRQELNKPSVKGIFGGLFGKK